MFQSLLSWIWLAEVDGLSSDPGQEITFQSLLSWIWLAEISCSMASSVRAREFQSLLSWIWLAELARDRRRDARLDVSILVVVDLAR